MEGWSSNQAMLRRLQDLPQVEFREMRKRRLSHFEKS
jgi:hypothetical protein